MSELIPVQQLLTTGIPAFVVGVLVGRYQERHKEKMGMRDFANTYRLWYDRWAPVVVTAVAILAVVGIWIGAAATITNAQQDRRTDAANTAVQKCFDRYAQAQSSSSKAVRVASEAKDIATAARDDALNREGRAFKALVRKILNDTVTPDDVQHLYATLDERDAAGRRLDAAQAELDRAREENPVPSAPSEFCSVKP
ncbi:hypothetical protein [Arthrobacter sp. Alg241-R88]|uniref:hypothetical protein n=1 Tax=Arthrobacter sp. Alg241-R88 TaxID=2305984 RepID=UPI0013D36FF8|nr:hypothetical protein [Arthrobacter sp. Alg241-R88]